MLRDGFASGRVVTIVLVLTAIEFLALAWHHRRTGRGVPPGVLARLLIPGVLLILALQIALTGGAWYWMALALIGSLICHLDEVRRRWR